MLDDIDIARQASFVAITQIARQCGIAPDEIEQYGPHKAKISLSVYERSRQSQQGKLILVSAITPTPAGIGKTTTTIGLGDALNRLDKQAIVCQ